MDSTESDPLANNISVICKSSCRSGYPFYFAALFPRLPNKHRSHKIPPVYKYIYTYILKYINSVFIYIKCYLLTPVVGDHNKTI